MTIIAPVWEQAGLTLFHGDCLDILPALPPKSVDLVLCDMPFGTTAAKWDTPIPLAAVWTCLKRLVAHGTPIVLFGKMPFTAALVMSNVRRFRYQWIWQKERGTGFQSAKYQPLRKTEDILVFGYTTPRYFPQKVALTKPYRHILPRTAAETMRGTMRSFDAEEREYAQYTHSYPHDVLVYPRPAAKDRTHAAQKPVPLLRYLIETYTHPGAVVLDYTFGSCSTGVACHETHRRFIGVERDAAYVAAAITRLETMIHAAEMSSLSVSNTR